MRTVLIIAGALAGAYIFAAIVMYYGLKNWSYV